MFFPREGPSLQTQAPRLKYCPKAGLPLQTQEARVQFYEGWKGAVASRGFLQRSEKIPGAATRRWGELIWLTRPSGLHRNSPQGLNISPIRVFGQIRDPEIPITHRPHIANSLKPCSDIANERERMLASRYIRSIWTAKRMRTKANEHARRGSERSRYIKGCSHSFGFALKQVFSCSPNANEFACLCPMWNIKDNNREPLRQEMGPRYYHDFLRTWKTANWRMRAQCNTCR